MKNKNLTMTSYGFGKFLMEFLTGAYGAIVFKFYETEIGLPTMFVTLAIIIYSIWNAFNDPLIGYFTSKKSFFIEKIGYRMFWIIFGIIMSSTCFFLIFAVPSSWIESKSYLFIFLYMVVTVCLYDSFYSMWEVNYQAVFPDKFRTQKERTNTSAIATVVGVFGIAAGFIVPPMFFEYGVRESYITCGLVMMLIGYFVMFLLLLGVKETPEMKERYKQKVNEVELSFFTQMKAALSNKNLLAMLLLLFLYQSACMCMTSSVHYVTEYILELPSSSTTIIFAGMLIGAISSILIWKPISKKPNMSFQKLLMICLVWMALAAAPMTFSSSIYVFIACMSLWGIGFGGFFTFMNPALSDIIDSIVVKNKRRDDGLIMGFRAFFMRLSYMSQAIVFLLCHELTGFDPNNMTQTAKFGISLHMGLIPALFLLAGFVVFVSLNKLKVDEIEENRIKLQDLNL